MFQRTLTVNIRNMPTRYDFNAQRLFIDVPLKAGTVHDCLQHHANYLLNVLRLNNGANILVFNGRDGEWQAEVQNATRRACQLRIKHCLRPQEQGPDIHYLFAPLKRARLDFVVQKATELGASKLQPVMTRRTQVDRVNEERMQANAIEAAEQCGILYLPEIEKPEKLSKLIASWPTSRHLIFCDEDAEITSPIDALNKLDPGPLAVLVGPEGGFDDEERKILHATPFTTAISLGPRIMRADTAAIAALSLVNAVLGDWRGIKNTENSPANAHI